MANPWRCAIRRHTEKSMARHQEFHSKIRPILRVYSLYRKGMLLRNHRFMLAKVQRHVSRRLSKYCILWAPTYDVAVGPAVVLYITFWAPTPVGKKRENQPRFCFRSKPPDDHAFKVFCAIRSKHNVIAKNVIKYKKWERKHIS